MATILYVLVRQAVKGKLVPTFFPTFVLTLMFGDVHAGVGFPSVPICFAVCLRRLVVSLMVLPQDVKKSNMPASLMAKFDSNLTVLYLL